MNIRQLPNFLFYFFPLELILQANIYYHYNYYGKRNKWFFLNLKKKEEVTFDDENKRKIAEDVIRIEEFATVFGCSEIVSSGNNEILQISDKINKRNINLKIQTSIKKMKTKRTSSKGLDVVKRQLGI